MVSRYWVSSSTVYLRPCFGGLTVTSVRDCGPEYLTQWKPWQKARISSHSGWYLRWSCSAAAIRLFQSCRSSSVRFSAIPLLGRWQPVEGRVDRLLLGDLFDRLRRDRRRHPGLTGHVHQPVGHVVDRPLLLLDQAQKHPHLLGLTSPEHVSSSGT